VFTSKDDSTLVATSQPIVAASPMPRYLSDPHTTARRELRFYLSSSSNGRQEERNAVVEQAYAVVRGQADARAVSLVVVDLR